MTERAKQNRILDLTSFKVEAFDSLIPAFETASLHHRQDWTMAGTPRQERRSRQYTICPLPTSEDRLLVILMSLKQAPTQVAHGTAGGMGQCKAHQWMHVRLPAVRNTLLALGDVPRPGLADLEQRLASLTADAVAAPFCHDETERPIPLPDGRELVQDLGVQGDALPGVQHTPPMNKPNGGQLTPAQNARHPQVARRRGLMAHVISSVTRDRIVNDTIRVWKDSVRDVVMAVCGA